jgi:hypothetical protein
MTAPIDSDRTLAALTDFCEASSGTPEDRRLVMWTIFNRMRIAPSRYGRSPAGVCVLRMQFSEFNGDAADNRNLERGVNTPGTDPIMLDCAAAYDEVSAAVQRGDPDPTDGATGYYDHSLDGNPPYWSKPPARITKVTGKFTFVADVP